MKFREYENVRPLTITEYSASDLDSKIMEIGKEHNIIDLQFSTDCVQGKQGVPYGWSYHALLLVEDEEKSS